MNNIENNESWFAVQTISNQEQKVKHCIEKFKKLSNMENLIQEIIMPTENVTEVKNGKKIKRIRKFYPGYIFLNIKLYDENGKVIQKIWNLIQKTQGVIGFVGGDTPVALKPKEIETIKNKVKESEGKIVPKVNYEVGENVKIIDGPFLNLNGKIESIDLDKGKLQVSVSIFGRLTPLELEYWQIKRVDE